MKNYVKDRIDKNVQCIKKVDHFENQVLNHNADIYCLVASELFEVPVDSCKSYNGDGTKNLDGEFRRNVAKKCLLANKSIEDIEKEFDFQERELQQKIVKAFPYTSDDDLEIENLIFYDLVLNSCDFISCILSSIKIKRYRNQVVNQMSKCLTEE